MHTYLYNIQTLFAFYKYICGGLHNILFTFNSENLNTVNSEEFKWTNSDKDCKYTKEMSLSNLLNNFYVLQCKQESKSKKRV